jgi:hypothetical protein
MREFGATHAAKVELLRPAGVCIGNPLCGLDFRCDSTTPHLQEFPMVLTAAHIQPIVALIAGILILVMPRLLNLIVAIYLIFVGLAGLGVLRMLHIS